LNNIVNSDELCGIVGTFVIRDIAQKYNLTTGQAIAAVIGVLTPDGTPEWQTDLATCFQLEEENGMWEDEDNE
jgi:hypothetical protein